MREDDALDGEMRPPQWLRPTDPPPLDQDTVERMLAGALDPQDAPPGYAEVVRVLAAAAAPPTGRELAGEAAAVAGFRSAHRPFDASRRLPVLGRLLGVKALAATIAGAATIGTAAAAATGSLPAPAQRAAHRLLGAAGVPAEATPARPLRPDASPSALPGAVGLCRAWAAGEGGEHGKKLDSTAFDRLATAAGGAEKVPAYCTSLTSPKPSTTTTATRPGAARPGTTAATPDGQLVGTCRAWLDAANHGQPARLGKPVLDRLAAAAGGADKMAGYCTALVAGAASQTGSASPAPTPSAGVPQPSGHGGAGRATPSPRPTPHG